MNDRLTPESIRVAWRARPHDAVVGCRICCFDRIDSTNTWLRRAALAGAPEGTVALAEYQTAGRGQHGRTWVAPPSLAVLSSTLFRPNLPPDRLPSLTMLAGCAVAAAVEDVLGASNPLGSTSSPIVRLKWPNDLIAAEGSPPPIPAGNPHPPPDDAECDRALSLYRKLGGVLIEGTFEEGRFVSAVVGIGVNANFDPSDFPTIAAIATSLQRLAGAPIVRSHFVAALLRELDARYRSLRVGNVAEIYAEWRERLATLGCRVRYQIPATGRPAPDNARMAIAEDVLPTGEIILRTDDGHRLRAAMGDVSLTLAGVAD